MSMEIKFLKTRQMNWIEDTANKITHLLNYCTTYRESTIRYKYSYMQLYIYSGSSYQSESEAKSRAFRYFYLGQKLENMKNPNVMLYTKGDLHIKFKIMKKTYIIKEGQNGGPIYKLLKL